MSHIKKNKAACTPRLKCMVRGNAFDQIWTALFVASFVFLLCFLYFSLCVFFGFCFTICSLHFTFWSKCGGHKRAREERRERDRINSMQDKENSQNGKKWSLRKICWNQKNFDSDKSSKWENLSGNTLNTQFDTNKVTKTMSSTTTTKIATTTTAMVNIYISGSNKKREKKYKTQKYNRRLNSPATK